MPVLYAVTVIMRAINMCIDIDFLKHHLQPESG